MDHKEAFENIGNMVVVTDEFWGSYIGTLIEVRETRVGYFAKVEIKENIKEPSQKSVFHKDMNFDRQPYSFGTIRNFSIGDISLVELNVA
jgi:hypothetical protein